MGGNDILILCVAWATIFAVLTLRLGRARRKLLDESHSDGADGVSLTAADIPTTFHDEPNRPEAK